MRVFHVLIIINNIARLYQYPWVFYCSSFSLLVTAECILLVLIPIPMVIHLTLSHHKVFTRLFHLDKNNKISQTHSQSKCLSLCNVDLTMYHKMTLIFKKKILNSLLGRQPQFVLIYITDKLNWQNQIEFIAGVS